MSGRWWRRNAVALVALALLIPAGIYAVDTIEFGFVRNPDEAVAAGASADREDWAFGPVTIDSLDPTEVGAPSGTDPVVVTVRVDPGHEEIACLPPMVIDPATGREWRTVTDLDWTPAEDQQTYCYSDTVVPYDLVYTVLLGDDAPDRLVVELTVSDRDTAVDLRFDVDR